jgi:hypothetical protein
MIPKPLIFSLRNRDRQQLLQYLQEHHDETHQPAADYWLLLDFLNGENTEHGDCPVYAEIMRLRKLVDQQE